MELEPGEQTIFEGHPSWRSILGFYVKGILIAAVVGVIAALATNATITAGAVALVLVILLVAGWVKRIFTSYVITDRRLYIKRGIIARREQQTHLDRVQNVNTSQSVLQRMLKVGTVDFDTAAGDDYDFSFAGVASPQQVVHAVHRAQRADEPAPGRS
jgi:uncharacterized membrane protein YdbT with pleckstrin-like domain